MELGREIMQPGILHLDAIGPPVLVRHERVATNDFSSRGLGLGLGLPRVVACFLDRGEDK